MGFFIVEPEVAGASVQGSGASAVCVFDTWLGDELVRAHPMLLATTPLKAALAAAKPTGLTIARARVRRSTFFRRHSPDRRLPVFWALGTGKRPGVEDAAVTEDGSFVVSRRVLDVLMEFRVRRAVFAQYSPPATWRATLPGADGILIGAGERSLDPTQSASEWPGLALLSARSGHFRLESGHHGALWLDLDSLFVEPARVSPFVEQLAEALRPHDFDAVCGPLVGGAFLAQLLAAELNKEFLFTERIPPAERDGLYRVAYRLPGGLRGRARGRRVAIVDDVVSAGSAVRGTYAELRANGSRPVAIGALLALGSAASGFFATEGVPLVSVAQLDYDLWLPDECPLCASGTALEDVALTPPRPALP